MNILVLNSGSSSIKFQVVETDQSLIAQDGDRCLAKGQVERIGSLALVAFQAAGRAAECQERLAMDEPRIRALRASRNAPHRPRAKSPRATFDSPPIRGR